MFTLVLAWINAKYKSEYDGLFAVAFIFDIMILLSLISDFIGV